MDLFAVISLLIFVIGLVIVYLGIKVVPQSKVYIVERFGKYDKTLNAGLNLLVPGLQYVAHRVSILERQLPQNSISVITKDNVQLSLSTSVFYRVVEAQMAVYRIEDVDAAVETTTSAIIRAACGELDFDDVQSKRDYLNAKILSGLAEATKIWGIAITRTEILDVIVDDITRTAMQQQMAADREKRALIATTEGEKQAIQLRADAEYYTAQKQADAIRVRAEADAFATVTVSKAIREDGQAAIDFEIMKRKVEAIEALGSANNSKVLILPSDITGILGGLQTMTELIRKKRDEG